MSLWDNIHQITGSSNTSKVEIKPKKSSKYDCDGSNIIISRKGVSISSYLLQDLNIVKKVTNYFTIKIPTMTGYIKRVPNFTHDAKNMRYIFPRFGFLEYLKTNFRNYTITCKIGLGEHPLHEFKWTGVFKNNQPIIANHIMDNIFNDKMSKACKSGTILNLQAGQGKTFLAMGLMEKLQRKTLVVCHNKTIMYQWVTELKKSYPNNTVGQYYGEKKEDGDIVVGIINSLLMSPMQNKNGEVSPQTFFRKFGYVILDEVHEYCANTRKNIYSLANATYMLGLSATPDERSDGLDQVTVWNCGEVLVAKDLIGYTEDDIPFKGEVTMVKYTGHPDFTKLITNKALDIVSFSEMVSQICNDYYRTHLIVKLVYELRKSNKNIFIFADRRTYLEQIREELDRFKIINEIWCDDVAKSNIKSMRLVGGAKAEEIKFAEDNSNVILTTYQFMGTGKSIPKMDSIILTTPRKRKSKQFIGRIFRLGSNYSIIRKIIDIVDWSCCFKSQWYARKKYYDSQSYEINTRPVNYTDLEEEMFEMGILQNDNEDINIIDKSLTELEELLGKKKVLELDIDELELLNEYSSCSDELEKK
jgi:superfamily II DNA or RNA helicase